MTAFTLISCLILYALTFLCFFIPFKSGQKLTGQLTSIILGILITLTIILDLDFITIFIFLLILIFQITFLTYWAFRFFGKRKAAKISTALLAFTFLLFLFSPWISDWIYSKKDVRKVLSFHEIEVNDNFDIVKNESGGFRDFYETFTIKISESDFKLITNKIKNSKNYKGFYTDYNSQPSPDFKIYDTVDFETPNYFQREYFSAIKMKNGTFHFLIQFDKKSKELSYVGSNE